MNSMKEKTALLAAGVLATGLIAAGCGDDEVAALSKSEFIAQADSLCKQADADLEQASAAFGDARPSDAQLESFATETVVPNIQGQIDGVRALGAPAGDEDKVAAFLDAGQAGLDQVEADSSILIGGKGPSGFTRAEKLGRAYGFESCAQ